MKEGEEKIDLSNKKQLSPKEPHADKKKDKSKAGKVFEFVSDLLINAVTIVGLVILIRYVFISPFEIKGESMEPNFHSDDLLIVDKFSKHFQDYKRGDVIVLIPPTDTKQYYVKRVIGLPGEKVQFKNGKVIVFNDENPDGYTLLEDYLPADFSTFGQTSEPVEIPENNYFALGDNREHSNDSRYWGSLPRSNIVGKAWVVLWPLRANAIVHRPEYSS